MVDRNEGTNPDAAAHDRAFLRCLGFLIVAIVAMFAVGLLT